jgi:ubiquinone biosynthesis UbiH/UbiF/VisC/COQ6 family hydroxylase
MKNLFCSKNFNILKRNTSFKLINKNFCSIDKDDTIESDVLIVGGGVPGLSVASALLKTDFFSNNNISDYSKIVIIDLPQKINEDNFVYKYGRLPDARVVSMAPASIRFFKSIGLWENLDERLIKFVKEMQIWENKGSAYVNMNSKDSSIFSDFLKFVSFNNSFFNTPNVNTDYICALVEINHLLYGFNKLLSKYEQSNQLKILNYGLEYNDIEIDNTDRYVHLKLNKKNKKFRTKLLIASDGAKSVIRNKLNIPTYGYEYNETGLVCTLKGNRGSDTAYQRFLHNGIFALLPLYDDLYSIVCSMPKNINENLKSLDESTFLGVVNKILHESSETDLLSNKLDRLIPLQNNFSSPPVMTQILSKKFDFNLQLLYSLKAYHKNTVFIGDAAHAIHPMAGQGLNLGIADSALLANELISALQLGRSINDKRNLDSFSNKSQINSKIMISAIEALKLLFLPTNYPFAEIRNFGMCLSNNITPIKSLFMTAASGELFQPKNYVWEKL